MKHFLNTVRLTFAALLLAPMLALAATVDINTADQAMLESLPGIGPAKATAIIDYRTKNGPFQTADDLVKVPGIGEKTMGALKPLISTGTAAPELPAVAPPAVPKM